MLGGSLHLHDFRALCNCGYGRLQVEMYRDGITHKMRWSW